MSLPNALLGCMDPTSCTYWSQGFVATCPGGNAGPGGCELYGGTPQWWTCSTPGTSCDPAIPQCAECANAELAGCTQNQAACDAGCLQQNPQ